MGMDILYTKVIKLGKVRYNKRRENEAELYITLYDKGENKVEFACSGAIWNRLHTDCLCCGQCVDTVASFFPHNKKVQRIKDIWRRYHLNDLHAGCIHQRKFENEPYELHRGDHCDICNYTYGTGWCYEEIPHEILEEIKSF